jgi:hypothetical protein
METKSFGGIWSFAEHFMTLYSEFPPELTFSERVTEVRDTQIIENSFKNIIRSS